ncbi:YafY family transcriptional regulator [Streptomyces pactum]|uniref:YafY family transcriptional regulator n=1 Tax=Streptomyces pactum TaxID=68249 RepID=A0ABS0NE86_9ACTN|nr:YafY family protein [Streptomyces pactum]MBH5333508.1 YafY family transcriptional regulator [Streptomyces pactum]
MTDTPARLLTLLSLLQTPREWPGAELAERLGVSRRTVRRDIDRLRELGYPVQASRGADGGYRLIAGKAMPPLVLDDEEAVAIAVGLMAGAGHAVEGVEEAAVRALAKLEQVLPSRLRHRVTSLQAATLPLVGGEGGDTVDPRTLTVMAAAVTGREKLRFRYRSGDGTASRRLTEPYRLVSTGRRWYLVAYDLDRADWRTFRIDRVGAPEATGGRFTPRELPPGGADGFVARSLSRTRSEHRLDVTFQAPAHRVAARLPRSLGVPEPDGASACRLRTTTADALEWVAARLALVGCEFTVHAPDALIGHLDELGARLLRAAADRTRDGGPAPVAGPRTAPGGTAPEGGTGPRTGPGGTGPEDGTGLNGEAALKS